MSSISSSRLRTAGWIESSTEPSGAEVSAPPSSSASTRPRSLSPKAWPAPADPVARGGRSAARLDDDEVTSGKVPAELQHVRTDLLLRLAVLLGQLRDRRRDALARLERL